jgi:predicted MFS family arabinose efflux permease
LIGLIFVQIFNTYPLFLRTVYQLTESRIGLLLAINTILIVLFEMVLINALKNKPLNKVIAVGTFLLGAGFALLPFGKGFWFAAFTVVVWTTGEMLSLPTLTTLIANHSHESSRGKYMGMFSVSFALALMIGPALGAAIYDRFGPEILWTISGILGIVILTGFLRLKKPVQS